MNQIDMNIKGIKCDMCDYRNDEVNVDQYEEWLNKPCPLCGANLLTEADYNNVKMIQFIVDQMNIMYPERDENEKIVTGSIEMNGTGAMEIKIKE